LDILKIFWGEAVVSDLLKNTKLNGGSTTTIVEAKRTLVPACGGTLPVEPLWVGTQFKLEPSTGRHYNSNEKVGNLNHDFPVCNAVPQPIGPPCF
jgi:hypothetical protein